MRYTDLFEISVVDSKVIDLLSILSSEGVESIPLDALVSELVAMGVDVDDQSLFDELDNIPIVNNIKDEIVNDKSIIHHYGDSDCFLKKSESDTFHHTSIAKSYQSMRESISQFDSNKYKQPKKIRIF